MYCFHSAASVLFIITQISEFFHYYQPLNFSVRISYFSGIRIYCYSVSSVIPDIVFYLKLRIEYPPDYCYHNSVR